MSFLVCRSFRGGRKGWRAYVFVLVWNLVVSFRVSLYFCGLIVAFPDHNYSCAYPESFVRGGPYLTTFFLSLMRGRRITILPSAGHIRSASKTPFKWRFAGVPMMALH